MFFCRTYLSVLFLVTSLLFNADADEKRRGEALDVEIVKEPFAVVQQQVGEHQKDEKSRFESEKKAMHRFLKTHGIHGFLSSEIRMRKSRGESDVDLYELLGVDVESEDPLSFHFLGRLTADLDGKQDQGQYYVFDSLADTHDDSVNGKLLTGHFDYRLKQKSIDVVQLGRMSLLSTPEQAFFDGVHVRSEELGRYKCELGFYGGVPVHLYESSSSGDSLLGGYASSRPWWGSLLSMDVMRLRDRNRTGDHHEDLWTWEIRQRLNKQLRLTASYSMLDNRDRDVSLKMLYSRLDLDLQIHAWYYFLINGQVQSSSDLGPYYYVLHELHPYHRARFLVSKGFGEKVIVDVGVDSRWLKDKRDDSMYNREYTRVFISPMIDGFPYKKSSLSVTGEIWDSNGRHVTSLGGEWSHACHKNLTASFGTFYSLYKFDFYDNLEKENVQSYDFTVKYQVNPAWKTKASYTFEEDESDFFHILKGELSCQF